jgi:hypothetical protein
MLPEIMGLFAPFAVAAFAADTDARRRLLLYLTEFRERHGVPALRKLQPSHLNWAGLAPEVALAMVEEVSVSADSRESRNDLSLDA